MRLYISHKIWGCQGDLFNNFKHFAAAKKQIYFQKVLQLVRKPKQKHSLKKKNAVSGITRQDFETI
jgi:hypothetical protein